MADCILCMWSISDDTYCPSLTRPRPRHIADKRRILCQTIFGNRQRSNSCCLWRKIRQLLMI
jgi:hypothetical protein